MYIDGPLPRRISKDFLFNTIGRLQGNPVRMQAQQEGEARVLTMHAYDKIKLLIPQSPESALQ